MITILLLLLLSSKSVFSLRIAEQKCEEYRKLTQKTSRIMPLLPVPTILEITSSKCPKTADLIAGGEAAKPAEFPHQALLGYPDAYNPEGDYTFICGGSLISERYVLTAAHCFKKKEKPTLVRLGTINTNELSHNSADFHIKLYTKHPNYRNKLSYHDIALVELAEAVQFSKFIRPACLWTGPDRDILAVIATGFGATEDHGPSSNILLKVKLDVFEKQECVDQFKEQKRFEKGIIDEQLCVGSETGGKDTCQGDSGGPIQVVTEPKACIFHVIGVTSIGSACGVGRSPAIYTRVASYVDWIESVIWPDLKRVDRIQDTVCKFKLCFQ